MAALWNRAGHYIFALWFLSFFFLLLFSWPNLSGRRLDVYHTSTDGVPCANLECRSEMCGTRLAGNAGRKKSPSAHHSTTLSGCIFAIKARIDNQKKIVKQQCPPQSTCLHNMANFGTLTAEIGSGVWGTQQISTDFATCLCYCSDFAHRRPTKLCMMFGRLLTGTLYIHFRGFLLPDRILPVAKFTLRSSTAFAYIGSVTARYSSSGRQPNFSAPYKKWNYGTFAEGATYIRQGGHHVGHRPAF